MLYCGKHACVYTVSEQKTVIINSYEPIIDAKQTITYLLHVTVVYHIARNVGSGKNLRIWRINLNSPKFYLSKFYCSYDSL